MVGVNDCNLYGGTAPKKANGASMEIDALGALFFDGSTANSNVSMAY